MRCSLDKVLLDARQLANRIRATDETADILIKQASHAHSKIIAKKQCQEEILPFDELNQIVKDRPRSRLMMCIASENKQLELLKQENEVLRTSLIEYETTFAMIMNKFRKHKTILKKLDQLERGDFKISYPLDNTVSTESSSGNRIIILCSKLTELKRAIEKALIVDNKASDDLSEIETKLSLENTELRRLLDISKKFQNGLPEQFDVQLSTTSDYFKSQSPQKTFRTKKSPEHYQDNSILNGVAKEKNRILSSASKIMSKFPPKIISNNHSSTKNKPDNVVIDHCTKFSDDEDDHSSVASDASVKTLI